MKFRLITTVWGERFTEFFLRITVRSLLSDGNIASLAARYSAVYTIYTTQESVDFFRKSALFHRLEALIPVEFVLFGPEEIDPKNSSSHWIGWRRGAQLAKTNNEIAFFIIADMLYATGTLIRWAELFEQGYRAVWTSATQVVFETAIEEVEARFPASSPSPISMSRAEVIRLAIRHLHPLIIAMFRDSQWSSRHPEVVFSEVHGEGLAERAIGSHPFCVDPNFFTMSDAFSPLDHFDSIAFDDSRGVGLEPMLKAPDLYSRIAPISADRLSNMGSWLDFFCTPSDLIESTHTYRFPAHNPGNDAAFRRVDAALAFYACQVRITGAIYRAIRGMRQAGCRLAAEFAATAHYAGRLRRHWRIKGHVTVFVPEDTGIEAFGAGTLDNLLKVGNEKALIDAVMAHVFPGKHQLALGEELSLLPLSELTAANGRSIRLRSSARIVSGPIVCDECTIYVITRPLIARVSVPEGRSDSRLPNQWAVHPARIFSPPSVPPSGPRVALPVTPKTLARRLKRYARLILRVGYRIMRSIPGAQRPADKVKRTLIRAILHLQSFHQRRRAATEREHIAEVATGSPTTGGVAPQMAGTPSEALVEAFYDIQCAQVMLTLAEILRFYRAKVLELTNDNPPLQAVESCIREIGLSEEKLKAMLQGILREAPDFAEAWYAMGDFHLSKQEYLDAVTCFDHCLLSSFAIPVPPGRTGYDVMAASAKASALEASGLYEEAAETYRRAINLGNQPGMVHVTYARLLRRLGRVREAAVEFSAGMETDHTAPILPPMPQDFAALARRLAYRFGQSPVATYISQSH